MSFQFIFFLRTSDFEKLEHIDKLLKIPTDNLRIFDLTFSKQ
jgi:hypothetical protein